MLTVEQIAQEEQHLRERWMEFDPKVRARIAGEIESERKQPEYKRIGLHLLLVDEAYQRAVSHERVMDIVEHFDWNLFNALWVGDRRRSGKYYVVDGRHRLLAAKLLGIKSVWCEVRPTTSVQEEARIFVLLTTKRRRLNSAQQFQAKLIYGDEEALRIDKLVSKHRFKIQDPNMFTFGGSLHDRDNIISAVGTLEAIYRNGGAKLLDRVLGTLRKAWDGAASTVSSQMIRAVARMYERHPDANDDAVARALGDKDPFALVERGVRFGHSNKVIQTEAIADVLERVAGL